MRSFSCLPALVSQFPHGGWRNTLVKYFAFTFDDGRGGEVLHHGQVLVGYHNCRTVTDLANRASAFLRAPTLFVFIPA